MSREDEDDALTIAQRAKDLARTHGLHADAFLKHPQQSIRRTELARAEQGRPPADPASGGGDGPLLMGRVLGEGGMGLVRAAEQTSLGREVAVKSLRASFQGEHATAMLLQEAFIMGRIEHPNILPIHDLQYDEAGEPHLVLKRIEGVEWRALIGDGGAVAEKFREDDLLEWNLSVLIQVCNAVHFAHSRGIIHRDLKPANVMIGSFGEVYVMDWGLALSMEEDEEGLLPLVEDAKQLAGTPQYMAPEMLGGREALLGPRTDVYLLGAILYEIITDLPPHDGATLEEILATVLRSRPEFPAEAPPELASICKQAMDPDPGWRHQTALELRRALQRFLEHAGSRRLEAQAAEHAAELRSRVETVGDPRVGEQDVSGISELFAQCRFAYRQALEIWSENLQAQQGLHRATETVVQHELDAGSARAAAQLLSTLENPDSELAARVGAALQAEAHAHEHIEELEELRRTTDIETGSRDRGIFAALLGGAWTLLPVGGSFMFDAFGAVASRIVPGLVSIVVLVTLLLVTVLARATVMESRLTQYLLGGGCVAMVALPLLDAAGWMLNLDVAKVQSLWPLSWFCISAMLAITVDRRMWPMTLGFLGALLVAVNWPEQRFMAMTASNFVMTVNMYSIWIRPSKAGHSVIDDGVGELLRRAKRR